MRASFIFSHVKLWKVDSHLNYVFYLRPAGTPEDVRNDGLATRPIIDANTVVTTNGNI